MVFPTITFLYPWVLGALLTLPILWYLLKVTPPAPKNLFLPTVRFLKGLIPDKVSPAHTPWWILLLRILIISLIIIALAGPVINPSSGLPAGKNTAIRIIIDNGWSGAGIKNEIFNTARNIIDKAKKEDRLVYILPMANEVGINQAQQFGPFNAHQAENILNSINIKSWGYNHENIIKAIKETHAEFPIHSFWLASGVEEGNSQKIADLLQNQGGVTIYLPKKEKVPVLLRFSKDDIFSFDVERADGITNYPYNVIIYDDKGQVIDRQETTYGTATFNLPEKIRQQISKVKIAGISGAGSVLISGNRFKIKDVGVVSAKKQNEETPFIDAEFYISRALSPYANLKFGSLEELMKKEDLSVIILPDIASMPISIMDKLRKWVEDGGVLVRFAGPNMAKNNNMNTELLPVQIRSGGRMMDGSMSWENPVKIDDFPENSPFYGIAIEDDIFVKRQILAEPSDELENKSWALLEDGTPLVTADKRKYGLVVLFHTTADASWSDLAISGLYVSMLKKIIDISPAVLSSDNIGKAKGSYEIVQMIDGSGNLSEADGNIKPIPVAEFGQISISSLHPAGIYKSASDYKYLNLGEKLPKLSFMDISSNSVDILPYDEKYENNLSPYILLVAFLLFIIDWLIMIFISYGFTKIFRLSAVIIIIISFSVSAFSVDARAGIDDYSLSRSIYLSYIITGNSQVDNTSKTGLEALAKHLFMRTSIEPEGVVGVNPETDKLLFFPFIYWPISDVQTKLSDKAINNIQDYINHGGIILFDTRDQIYSSNNPDDIGIMSSKNSRILRDITAPINIPPLQPIANNHVLGKSFYLLKKYQGRFQDGVLWVEKEGDAKKDNVSSIIIGSNDYAYAWASNNGENLQGGSRQYEMSIRFGINLTMYALTGNYKGDQLHIMNILDRMGR